MASQLNSIKKYRKELTSILLKLFQKIAEEGKPPNSLYEATITTIPKHYKDAIKKEIKICIEMNENENKTTQNLWDSGKGVLR